MSWRKAAGKKGVKMKHINFKRMALAAITPVVALMSQTSSGAVVYSETSSLTAPYFVNSHAVNGTNTVTLDNILVPVATLPPGAYLQVTRVELQAVQSSNSPSSTVSLYYASLASDTTNVAPATITPPTAVSAGNGGVQTVTANGAGVAFKPIIFTNPANPGTAPLFTLSAAQLNYTDYSGSAEFVLGYQFSDVTGGTSPLQGERLAKPDVGYEQTVEYFEYNLDNNTQAAYTFFIQGDPNDGAGIYVILQGNVLVPEPASLGLLALGGLALARRPRRELVTA